MARTKTQAIINLNPKPAKKSAKKPPQPRSPGKKLTLKQMAERRNFISEMVKQANTEHDKDKEQYLTRNSQIQKKITFSSTVHYSNGEEIEIEFADGNSAKKMMNLAPKKTPQEKKTSPKKRKFQETQSSESHTLKKTKIQT